MKDILKFRTNETKVRVCNGSVDAFRYKQIERTGARVFEKGSIASASYVGSISDEELYNLCREHREVALPTQVELAGSGQHQHIITDQHNLTSDGFVDVVEEHLKYLRDNARDFNFNGNARRSMNTIAYRNDLGSDLKCEYYQTEFFGDIRRRGSPNIMDAYFHYQDLTSFHVRPQLEWLVEQLASFDNIVRVTSGKKKILMLPDERSLSKVGESLRADLYHSDAALYSGRLQQKIFSEQFTLRDARIDPEHGVFTPFDYEGTLHTGAHLDLISRGVLEHLISDLKTEKKHGVPTTGNGYRTFDSQVKLDFSQLQVAHGKRSFREILKDAGEVIVVEMGFGGDLTANGDFSTPVQLAYLVNNGEVRGRLPQCSLNSKLEEMWGAGLLEVANDGPSPGTTNPYMLMEMNLVTH